MNDVEKFLKKYEMSLQEQTTHDTAVALQKKKIEKLDAEMNIAATAGDVELFRKIKQEKTAEEDALVVLEASFAPPAPDREDAVNAWTVYRTKYKGEFANKYDALKAARSAVKDAMEALADCQNEALILRERLADVCGINYSKWTGALDIFPVEQLHDPEYVDHPRFMIRLPEAAYLTELGFCNRGPYNQFDEVEKYHRVFKLERACK